ncbi:hypothetical protein RB595_003702 [Gaeumannomyces hyphopodioides]
MWKFKITREQATNWALRDVKFLIYDDTEMQENGFDSDDEEGMLQQAIKMSTSADGPSHSHAPSASTSQANPPHQRDDAEAGYSSRQRESGLDTDGPKSPSGGHRKAKRPISALTDPDFWGPVPDLFEANTGHEACSGNGGSISIGEGAPNSFKRIKLDTGCEGKEGTWYPSESIPSWQPNAYGLEPNDLEGLVKQLAAISAETELCSYTVAGSSDHEVPPSKPKDQAIDSDDEEGMMQLGIKMSMETEINPTSAAGPSSQKASPTDPYEPDNGSSSRSKSGRLYGKDGSESEPKSDSVHGAYERILEAQCDLSSAQDRRFAAWDNRFSTHHQAESGPSKRSQKVRCKVCSDIPEFPSSWKPRKFRLFEPSSDPSDTCRHYVAVSYCWPPEGTPAPSRTCRVRDLDGTTRRARASDDVLDRAIDFANTCGLRMIWIDQECLPQPTENSSQEDKDYQRIGIQAMDIVYNRALVTAGLHDTVVVTQRQLNAIDAFLRVDTTNNKINPKDQHALGFRSIGSIAQCLASLFLMSVTTDRWYTRAWVAQEATNASSSLFLVFRREAGAIGREAFRYQFSPPHSLDASRRELPSEVVGISIREYNRLLEVLRLFYPTVQSRVEKQMLRQGWIQGQLMLLDTAEGLLPDLTTDAKSNPLNRFITPIIGRLFGKEQSMDAATALTLLRSRECRDTCDRLTMVANMCRYETRLDTTEIAIRYRSLRTAVLSLALLNQDLSLLVPEIYVCSEAVGSLYSPFDTHLETICNPNPRLVRRAMPTSTIPVGLDLDGLRGQGLLLPAYIWMVDKELDLSILRDQFSELWHSFKIVIANPIKLEGESKEAMGKRMDLARAHFAKIASDKESSSKFNEELIRHGFALPQDSPFWGGINPDGVKLEALLDVDSIEHSPRRRESLATIIFVILHYLFKLQDPLAAGLANSIWQSLRVAAVSHQRLNLPDTVCEELFAHPDVHNDPFSTLQLDRDRTAPGRSGYHQTWFVERIMTKGTLWVGSYHPLTFASGSRSRKGKEKADSKLAQAADSTPHWVKWLDGKSILTRQVWAQVNKDVMSREMLSNPGNVLNNGHTPSDWISFTLMLHSLQFGSATSQEEPSQRLVSAFNVDGPCVVATPFNSAWEMLPHPEIRSMSTCWVVEKVGEEPSKKEPRGLGQFTGNKVDKGKRREGEEGENEEKSDNSDSVGPDNTFKLDLYKVVGKVQGLWELILSMPFQHYRFI